MAALGAPSYPPPATIERTLDLLFPPLCVGCRRVGRWICERCWDRVSWHQSQACGRCRRPSSRSVCLRCAGALTSLDGLVAVAEFDGVAREAVHALKYNGRHAIAGMLGRLMAGVAPAPVDLVVPVPLHASRRRERGYDQSALLAGRVARELGLPHAPRALTRTRRTEQQATLQADRRRANVAGAFVSRPWRGEAILLVDDVATTGATIDAAARALKEAGAGKVMGLVFAQAV